MLAYRTPGVYFEWPDRGAGGVRPARVDIAGFVGIATRGPLFRAVCIESWNQFTSTFGSYCPQGYLAYAVQGFFRNGGQVCWVVRVADRERARFARLDIVPDARVPRKVRLTATSPGGWAHDIELVALRWGTRFSFLLRLPSGEQEIWRDLSLDPGDERYVDGLLRPEEPALPGSRVPIRAGGSGLVTAVVMDSGDGLLDGVPVLGPDGTRSRPEGGADGLAGLEPADVSAGLAVLADVTEISVVAIPDIMRAPRFAAQPPHPEEPDCADLDPVPRATPLARREPEWPAPFTPDEVDHLQLELVGHCERLRNRVAILDTTFDERSQEAVLRRRQLFDSSFAALYHPWLRVPDPVDTGGRLKDVPPSGHVAGIFARVEALVGAHKPPANEIVEPARDLSVAVDDVQHGYLNDHRVNVIRSIPGRGLRVAGARTLSSDPQWRYVNVRRLLIMIERSIDAATQWLVFEPNDPAMWRDLDRTLRVFLDALWQRGMLEGSTAAEAYDVVCDASSNPATETDAGRLIAVIGVQPPMPAEFVVVRIGKTEGGIAVL